MKVPGLCRVLSCILLGYLGHIATGKSLFQSNTGAIKSFKYPVKRIAPKPVEFTGELTANDFEDTLFEVANGVSTSQLNRKRTPLRKRNLFSENAQPFGVVFSRGKAIGLLQPINYELSAFEENNLLQSDLKASKKREVAKDDAAGGTSYTNRYPEVLANFKIGHKLLMMKLGQDHKRENTFKRRMVSAPTKLAPSSEKFEKRGLFDSSTNKQADKRINTQRLQANSEISHEKSDSDIDEIEDNIRGVITDLGLGKDEKQKRSVDDAQSLTGSKEDENMEMGANHIAIRRDDYLSRQKKDNLEEKIESTTCLNINVEKRDVELKSDNIREKREGTDIVRGLETSGDLTVSGNKSPLASTSNEHEVNMRSTQETTDESQQNQVKVKRQNTKKDIEKEIEENLEKKINAIKDQVKREYNNLNQRSKRETAVRQNTLIDEEVNSINPDYSAAQSLLPHIRAKRDKLDPNSAKEEKVVRAEKQAEKRQLKSDVEAKKEDDCPKTLSTNNNNNNNNEKSEVSSNQKVSDLSAQRDILQEMNHQADQAIRDSNVILERVKNEVGISTSKPINSEECPDRTKINEKNNMQKTDVEKDCPKVKKRSDEASLNKKDKIHEAVVKKNGDNKLMVNSRSAYAQEETAVNNLNDDANLELRVRKRRRRSNPMYKKRFIRQKRASMNLPESEGYYPYRSEDNEVDEEGDEFDDDGFDDRTSSFVRNRRSDYSQNPLQDFYSPNNEYDALNDEEYSENSDYYYPKSYNKHVKRSPQVRDEYDTYDDDGNYQRRKRQSYEDVNAGDDGAYEHRPSRKILRRKRLGVENANTRRYDNELTDSDIFGALPQSYEGELNRYKRVKRSSKQKPSS